MEDLIIFLIALIFCTIGRFILYLVNRKRSKSKKKVKKELMPLEIKYLSKKFKIKKDKLYKNSFMLFASFIDAFIVGITVTCVIKVSDFIYLQMFLGLIVVLALIYIMYEIIGKIIVKKGDKK